MFSEHYKESAPGHPATDPREIAVLRPGDELPPGLGFVENALKLAENFPSPDSPHIKLGTFSVYPKKGTRRRATEEEFMERVMRAAGHHGANAVFVPNNTYAVLLRLSDAEPVFPDAEELLADLHQGIIPSKYKREKTVVASLEANTAVRVKARPSHCYAVAYALNKDARFAADLGRALAVLVQQDSQEDAVHLNIAGTFYLRRAAFQHLACTARSAPLSIELRRGRRDTAPLGTGKVSIRLYSFSVSSRQRRQVCARCSWPGDRYDRNCLWRDGLSPGICR